MDALPNLAAGAAVDPRDSGAGAVGRDQLVAVIGCGAMGAGIAQVAAAAGHRVMLYDSSHAAVTKARDAIAAMFVKLADKGRMSAQDAAAAGARLHSAASLADVAGAALVVEAIVEDLAAKQALFAELETLVDQSCILATNTSSISVTAIAATLRRPQRLVGMHFFNPVPLMALVEVVSGLATDGAVAATVYATAIAWGKSPVHARSTPGFIVNRVARPFYAEALRLLSERAADHATLDAVLRESGGFRMGPFELMDLIGHDVNFAVTQSVFQAYFGDPRFTPSVLQRELLDAGFLGRKAGRGFYRYDGGPGAPPVATEARQRDPELVAYWTPVSGGGKPAGSASLLHALAQRLQGHGVTLTHRTLEQGHHGDGAAGLHCHGAAIYLSDGRSATRRAADNQHADTVLFDLALDYASAPRIAVSCADQCSAAAFGAAVGMFQAAGFSVTRLDDVPGMAVMRTVAMLANEAADAVNQGVCSAAAVDTAMQKGLNYPRGPLAWADSIGLEHVVRVLDNLAAAYGEARYRVAPLLRRRLAGGAARVAG